MQPCPAFDTCLAFIETNGNVKNTAEGPVWPFSSETRRCEAQIAAEPRQGTRVHAQAQRYASIMTDKGFCRFW